MGEGSWTLPRDSLQPPQEDGVELKGPGTKAYRPGRGQQGQVCLTLLVLTTVLLKRDLKDQDRTRKGAQAPDPAELDMDPRPTCLPPLPLTSLVTACIEGLRMGCAFLPC